MMATIETGLEQDALRERIRAAEASLAAELATWRSEAEALDARVDDALAVYRGSRTRPDLKALNIARADRRNLRPEPVEPISVGLLKGRLELLESRR